MTEIDSRSWLTDSIIITGLRMAAAAVGEGVDESRSVAAARVMASAAGTSKLAGLGSTLARWSRSAWLYRWLTAEPEADVVVIDLRDSLALRPLFVVIDSLASVSPWLANASAWRLLRTAGSDLAAEPVRTASLAALAAVGTETALSLVGGGLSSAGVGVRLLLLGVALAGTRVRYSPAELRETRVYGLLAQLVVPPEPVEQREREWERGRGREREGAQPARRDDRER